MLPDTRQHPERWARDRFEWLAALLILVPFIGLVVLLNLLGVGTSGLLAVTLIVGIPASSLRRRVAARLRARKPPR